jgi:hypothetical protein
MFFYNKDRHIIKNCPLAFIFKLNYYIIIIIIAFLFNNKINKINNKLFL